MVERPEGLMFDDALSGGGEMGASIRALDWSQTPLGPVDTWPQSLKTSVSICLNSRFPVLIWWGRDLVKIYNDAYVELIGSKHPAALGRPGRLVWPEIWDTIGPMLAGVMERGEATWADDLLLMLHRNGYPEECYFTFSYSAIRDESGGIGGVFTPVVETTEKVIGERRLRTLRALATARNHRSHDANEACMRVARGLESNPYDVPFAAIYLLDESRKSARLAASAVEMQQQIQFPATIDLCLDPWLRCRELVNGDSCVLPVADLGLLPPARGGEPSVEQAIAVAVRGALGAMPTGFLLAAVSAHKRLDDRYHAFYSQVAAELGEAIREARMLQRETELQAQAEAERTQAEAERTKIRELFMQAPAAIMMLQGASHKIVLVNQNYVKLLGRKSEDNLVGKTLAEALPELASQGFFKLLDEVYQSGRPFLGNEMKARLEREGSGQTAEGYFNFVYQPTRDVSGAVDGILIHAVEVTEQVTARQEVESREEQFRVLADSIPQMAWMANAEGDLFWYNRRWYEYTGTTIEQMRGWGWQALHDPELLPRVIERYRQSLSSGEPFAMTFPLRGADGTFRSFLTLALPVRDASGKIVRWFGTNTDIEEQRRTEEAMRQSEKLAAVGRLASSIAHEINNPLEAVTNLIYLAKSTAVKTEAKEYLESAEAELGRMAQITTQTLRFHKQLTAPAPTDIAELLDSLTPLYRSRLSQLGAQLKVETRDCAPLICYAGDIRQVMANLVGNAIDALGERGTLRLRVRACTNWGGTGSGVRITVADTGHGMSAQTMKRVYEPFFTTKEAFGTGLGLWVSAGIVEKHGGRLRVRSRQTPGKCGTVFTVYFPYGGALEKGLSGPAPAKATNVGEGL